MTAIHLGAAATAEHVRSENGHRLLGPRLLRCEASLLDESERPRLARRGRAATAESSLEPEPDPERREESQPLLDDGDVFDLA